MEWFGVDVADILSADWLALPEAPRAHWLSLHAYCALHENGGVLKGAAKWVDRQWSFAAGLRLRSVKTLLDVGLLRISTDSPEDYILANYDSRGESKTREKSQRGTKAANTRWHGDADASAGAHAQKRPGNTRTDGRTNERTDVRRNGEMHAHPPRALELTNPEPDPPNPVNQLRDLFQPWFRERYPGDTYAWGKVEAAKAKQLLSLAGDRGVDEVMRKARIAGAQSWRKGGVTLGVLIAAWNELTGSPPASTPPVDPLVEAVRAEAKRREQAADRAYAERMALDAGKVPA